MKTALIPPFGNLDYSNRSDMHLVLAPQLVNPDYKQKYFELRARDDFVILDNGAYERSLVSLENLFTAAMSLGPQELVVPDVPLDTGATIEAAKRTFSWLLSDVGFNAYGAAGAPALMLVPQGKTIEDWSRCLRQQIALHALWAAKVDVTTRPTIALAKHHDAEITGGHFTLLRQIEDAGLEDLPIHMLGWPDDPWSLQDVARDYPYVRSVDSAKPFVYAFQSTLIDPDRPIPVLHRGPDYFTSKMNYAQEGIADRNIEAFTAFAEARA